MDEPTYETSPSHDTVLSVPDEILLQILQYLEYQDILAFKKTCTRLYVLAQDRYVWLLMLRDQSRTLPLPAHLEQPSSWTSLSSDELETLVRQLSTVNHTWLLPRYSYFIPGHSASCILDPMFSNDDGARTIYSIEVLLDRWLLCIYHEKLVELWDLDSTGGVPSKPVRCTSQRVQAAGSFSSAITHLKEDDNTLTVAVSCHEHCHVIQVQLYPYAIHRQEVGGTSQEIQFHTLAVIPFASPIFCLRALDPNQSLLLLGLPSSFHLLNWVTRERTVVNMLSEDEEELWNGVIGATFLTWRHILVLKAHSLEICTLLDSPQTHMNMPNHPPGTEPSVHDYLPPPAQMSAAVHSHFFPSTTFRGVSFSRPATRASYFSTDAEEELTHVSLTFLAYDVLRGLFYCSVSVIIPSAPDSHNPGLVPAPPLDVQVCLLAAHNMAVPLEPGNEGTQIPRSGFSHGTRGFVSACALGRSGHRGVWVERRRGAVRRVVYGFSAPRALAGEEQDDVVEPDAVYELAGRAMEGFQPGTPISVTNSELDPEFAHSSWHAHAPRAIEGKEVYDVNSYDLRDDITHIAFSEMTGVIVLGTRKGDVRVLGRSAQRPNGV